MKYIIEAACHCHKGKIRSNNEDNFYFDGKCLEVKNNGLRHVESFDAALNRGTCVAVFDGMGGENFGEYASFAAAQAMRRMERSHADYFIPEKQYLERMVAQLNEAVVALAEKLAVSRMGTTMVALFFSGKYAYVCNLGDSRAFRLRSGEFLQLSEDHIISCTGRHRSKASLSQYLGVDPSEMQIEPYIAKGKLEKGDQYLICSDGLTDMVTNCEIADIMINSMDAESCVEELVQAALDRGGKDNITAILCRIQ